MTSVRELLGEYLDGIRRRDLIALVREHINPDATDGQLGVELEQLGDEIIEEAGLIRLRRPAEDAGAAQLERGEGLEGPSGPRRLVAVDLETVLRYTTARPDGERTIFQVGPSASVRTPHGLWRPRRSTASCGSRPNSRPGSSRPTFASRLRPRRRVRRRAQRLPRLHRRGRRHRGLQRPFVRLSAPRRGACQAPRGRHPSRIKRVDGLYLALAVWPVPPRRHALSRLINDERFDQIRARLEIDLTGVVAHDAVDDCRMLADLMRFAAAEIEAWRPISRPSSARSAGAQTPGRCCSSSPARRPHRGPSRQPRSGRRSRAASLRQARHPARGPRHAARRHRSRPLGARGRRPG